MIKEVQQKTNKLLAIYGIAMVLVILITLFTT